MKNLLSKNSIAFLFGLSVFLFFICGVPTASAAVYYVSSSGSASWTECSDIQKPCSWQMAMANAQAGDTVYFREGVYEPGTGNQYSIPVMYPAHDGTENAPITFVAHPGETVTIHDASSSAVAPANNTKPALGCYRNSYIVWDGFSFVKNLDNGYQASSIVRFELSDHCTLKNSNLTGRSHFDYANGALISIVQSSYIYIHDNVLHGMSRDPNAIEATVNTSAIWVFDHDHVFIYNNDFYDNYGNISTKIGTSYLNIYNNHIWSCGHSAARVIPQISGTTDISIYQNVIRNCPVVLSSPDPAAPLHNVKLYNNTVYNSGAGTLAEVGSPSYQYHRNTEIFNNIISNQGSNSLFGRYFNSLNSGAGFPAYMDYNDFYGVGRWNMNYATDYRSLSAWQEASEADVNSIMSDPLFVNPGGADPEHYKLHDNSPARVGRGGAYASVMGAYIVGNETIGASPRQIVPQVAVDATSPSVPADLSAVAVSTSQITISWSASTDSVGVSGYRVFRNGAQIAELTGTTYVDSGLAASTAYAYAVSAYDAAGNNSAQTTPVSATTQVIVVPTSTPTSSSPASFPAPVSSESISSPIPTTSPSSSSAGGSSPAPLSTTQTQTSSPAIKEGSLIRGPDGIKVYIVNAHGYKRHIFNPAIFNMYGHFKWNEIKEVSQQILDSYITSDLYRADGDTKVFSLHEINEAQGLAQKRWFNTTAQRFQQLGYTFNQVFIINPRERDYYQEGDPITG